MISRLAFAAVVLTLVTLVAAPALAQVAEMSDGQAHGGTKSLKVAGVAELVFGEHDDLPVRVSLYLMGSHQAGPFYVDDVKVEYAR